MWFYVCDSFDTNNKLAESESRNEIQPLDIYQIRSDPIWSDGKKYQQYAIWLEIVANAY